MAGGRGSVWKNAGRVTHGLRGLGLFNDRGRKEGRRGTLRPQSERGARIRSDIDRGLLLRACVEKGTRGKESSPQESNCALHVARGRTPLVSRRSSVVRRDHEERFRVSGKTSGIATVGARTRGRLCTVIPTPALPVVTCAISR